MSITIGIDPGLDGAIVALNGIRKREVCEWGHYPMPVLKVKNKRTIDLKILKKIIENFNLYWHVGNIFIEHVHSMPKQGVASTFKFGYCYGAVRAAIEFVDEGDVVLVQPAVWKAALGLTADKAESLALATKLMPDSKEFWTVPRKKKQNEGVAEAALIAYYGLTHLS